MRLHVMRHGPAEDRAPSGRDFDRALTAAGREVVSRAASLLREARGGVAARVLASPFRRARQTAELVAAAHGVEVEVHDDLSADGDLPLDLVRELRVAGGDAILVGHQPIVEELIRALVHPARPSMPAGFRTATIVTLDHEDGDRWRVSGLIDPYPR